MLRPMVKQMESPKITPVGNLVSTSVYLNGSCLDDYFVKEFLDYGTHVVLRYHFFEDTPDEYEEIVGKTKTEALNKLIAKIVSLEDL